jgi:hypothetical protein
MWCGTCGKLGPGKSFGDWTRACGWRRDPSGFFGQPLPVAVDYVNHESLSIFFSSAIVRVSPSNY